MVAPLLPLYSLRRSWDWPLCKPYQANKPGKAAKDEADKYHKKRKKNKAKHEHKQRNRRYDAGSDE